MPRTKWYPPNVRSVSQRALLGAGSVILEEANRTVPHLEGVLQASGTVEADERTAVISYDTPYAVRQHEDLSLSHPGGRRAKWLQLAMQERSGRVLEWLGKELARALK